MTQSGWNVIAYALVTMVITVQAGCRVRTAASLDRGANVLSGAPAIEWPVIPAFDADAAVRGSGHTEIVPIAHEGPGRLALVRNEIDGELDLDLSTGTPFRSSRLRISTDPTPETRPTAEVFIFSAATTNKATFTPVDGAPVTRDVAVPDNTVLMAADTFGPPRGIVLFQSSLGVFTAGENAIVDCLTDRGWVVAWCSPSFNRLTTGFSGPDIASLAEIVSRRIDEDLANRAYAMDALLQHLRRERPELASLPVVAVGCSAGAISLPAMVARMPESIDAAVLVAGGADLFTILSESTLMREDFSLSLDGRPPTQAEREVLHDETLALAQLDPYRTATQLRHIPVLMLHATFDAIVPAHTGDLLYERAGRPERWSYPVGHLGLFVLLAGQADAIAEWVEAAVASEHQ